MLKTAGRFTKITNYIAVVLLFVLLLLQFLPYWTTSDGATTLSIQGYVWWPLEKPDGPAMTNFFKDQFGKDWLIDEVVLLPCLTLACAVLTFFFGIKKPNRLWMNIVYLTAGIYCVITFLTNPAYQLNGMYILHLILGFLLVAASVANIALRPWKKIVHYLKYGE